MLLVFKFDVDRWTAAAEARCLLAPLIEMEFSKVHELSGKL